MSAPNPADGSPSSLALDVGGTKLAACLIDARGTAHHTSTTPTPATADAESCWNAAEQVLSEVLEAAGTTTPLAVSGLGIGSAGPIDAAAGTVSPINIPAWRDFGIVEHAQGWLARNGLEPVPVRLIGDGAAAALGELVFGAAQGVRNAMVIVVSTGIGGGLIVDGAVRTGHTGSAGHIGHIAYEPGGRSCACGHRGCVEAYASGPSMTKRAIELGWTPPPGVAPNGQSLIAAHRAGEQPAVAAIAEGMAALAQAIADTSALVELDAVYLGGGMMNAADVLLPLVRAALTESTGLAYVGNTAISAASLGSAAGLAGAGAAVLYQQQLSSGV